MNLSRAPALAVPRKIGAGGYPRGVVQGGEGGWGSAGVTVAVAVKGQRPREEHTRVGQRRVSYLQYCIFTDSTVPVYTAYCI